MASIHDILLLGGCFRGFVLPVLEYRSAVWCSDADTTGPRSQRSQSVGMSECDLAHSRSVTVLFMVNKIRCNPLHPLYALEAMTVPPAPVRVTRGADRTSEHLCASSLQNLAVSQDFFSLVSEERFSDPAFDGVGLAGVQSRVNAFLLD